jgi:hypothetical protein
VKIGIGKLNEINFYKFLKPCLGFLKMIIIIKKPSEVFESILILGLDDFQKN